MIEEYLIGQQIPDMFVPLIPLHYAQMVEQGELLAVGAYDTWDEEAVGILAFRRTEGWMELVWLNFSENYRESEDALRFVARRLEQAKKAGVLNGAFIDFADEKEAEPCAWILRTLGFRKDSVSTHVYELTLADVKDSKSLHRETAKNVRPLGAVGEEVRRKLVKAVAADARAVPLEMPVDWSLYDEAVSVVYINGTVPEGALLFERQEKDLIFSCAWASEPKKMMAMLAFALAQAERELPEDTTILIPVLGHRVAELVERLVPTAACRMIDEWSLGFRI